MSDFIPRGADGHVLQKLWVWSPETIDDIQTKAELGRYTNRGARHHPAHAALRGPDVRALHALAGAAGGLPRDAATPASRSAPATAPSRSGWSTPITIAGMSYGALSRNAKQALGMARHPGRHLDHHRRRRHARPRARGLRPAGLPGAAEPLRLQPAPPADGQRGRDRDRPGRQARHRRRAAGREGVDDHRRGARRCRPASTSARPAATPTSSGPTTCRSRSRSCARRPTARSRSTSRSAPAASPTTSSWPCKAGADVIVIDGLEGGTGASPRLADGPHRHPHAGGGWSRRVAALREMRLRGRRQPDRLGRHPKRRRRRQGAGARRRRGLDRHRRDDRARLQRARCYIEDYAPPGHRARRLPPLPHRPLPGRDHHAGRGSDRAAAGRRGRRPRRGLPQLDDAGDADVRAGVRQDRTCTTSSPRTCAP